MPDWLTTASTQSQFDDIAEYSYDLNGNMNKDLNKSISSITYNYLNLPANINVTGKGTITYSYDAAGNKLKKVSSDNTVSGKTILTTTEYIAGFVYESKQTTPANIPNDDYSNRLQFMGQEEGRIRALYNNTALPNNITGFAFDYMIKDHLGNVRMVLTDEVKQNTYPAATLEGTYDASTNSMVNYEKGFYKIDPTKIISETAIPSWNTPTVESVANTRLYYNNNGNPPANINYPSGCAPVQTAGSAKLYKLNATTNRTGLEFMIKVMAGDKIDIFGKSYFLNTATINNSNSTPLDLAALMANLLLTPANAAAGKGITSAQLTTINTGQVPTSFFRGTNGETTTIPKAYINYIFLDEQFKFAGGNFSRVGSTGIVKDHWYADAIQLQNLTVPKNGYIFVYVSNESNLDVFFDNLQVIHKPGPILEETHYYPFGLTMAGISSKAAGSLENKRKWNKGSELESKEFSDGSGLELYSTFYRSLDPQLGRFWQIDPKPNYDESPYTAMGNNPILRNDPLGDTTSIGDSRNATIKGSNGKTYSGATLTKKLVKEWEKIGGIKLAVNKKSGEVEFKGNKKNAQFSQTGRTEIMKMVTGNGQVKIDFSTTMSSQTNGNNISLNPSQVDKMVNGASSDLNSETVSYGMVALHEYNHTTADGGQSHSESTMSNFGMIDQPDITGNQIRSEMSTATGTNWGQRESYSAMSINGTSYLPFSFLSMYQVQTAKAYEGTFQGFLRFQPPTTSVITIPPGE